MRTDKIKVCIPNHKGIHIASPYFLNYASHSRVACMSNIGTKDMGLHGHLYWVCSCTFADCNDHKADG